MLDQLPPLLLSRIRRFIQPTESALTSFGTTLDSSNFNLPEARSFIREKIAGQGIPPLIFDRARVLAARPEGTDNGSQARLDIFRFLQELSVLEPTSIDLPADHTFLALKKALEDDGQIKFTVSVSPIVTAIREDSFYYRINICQKGSDKTIGSFDSVEIENLNAKHIPNLIKVVKLLITGKKCVIGKADDKFIEVLQRAFPGGRVVQSELAALRPAKRLEALAYDRGYPVAFPEADLLLSQLTGIEDYSMTMKTNVGPAKKPLLEKIYQSFSSIDDFILLLKTAFEVQKNKRRNKSIRGDAFFRLMKDIAFLGSNEQLTPSREAQGFFERMNVALDDAGLTDEERRLAAKASK